MSSVRSQESQVLCRGLGGFVVCLLGLGIYVYVQRCQDIDKDRRNKQALEQKVKQGFSLVAEAGSGEWEVSSTLHKPVPWTSGIETLRQVALKGGGYVHTTDAHGRGVEVYVSPVDAQGHFRAAGIYGLRYTASANKNINTS